MGHVFQHFLILLCTDKCHNHLIFGIVKTKVCLQLLSGTESSCHMKSSYIQCTLQIVVFPVFLIHKIDINGREHLSALTVWRLQHKFVKRFIYLVYWMYHNGMVCKVIRIWSKNFSLTTSLKIS